MIIWDNHMHLRREGRFLDAVRDFKHAGGTHLVLCQLPCVREVIKHKSYLPLFLQTLKMSEEIREVGVTVFVTVGPYPVDYIYLRKEFGRQKTVDIMKKGMDDAGHLCAEGKCIGIGEIGRPHFPVEAEVIQDSNEILLHGMGVAADMDTSVVLHTENTTSDQCKELVDMAQKAGLPAGHVIKHFSPPLITHQENHGLFPSIVSTKKNIVTALEKGTRFLMETDYIDDMQRPGAVLGPRTVPHRTRALLDQGIMTTQQAYEIHVTNPERAYNLVLES